MGNLLGSILKNGMMSEALETALTGALNAGDKRLVCVALFRQQVQIALGAV